MKYGVVLVNNLSTANEDLEYLFFMICAISAGMIGTYFGVMIMFKLANDFLTRLVKIALILLALRLIFLGLTSFSFS